MLLQLAGPGARHRLEGTLAASVQRQVLEAHLGADTRNVDDAARAVVGEKWLDGLGEENGAQDVDGVDLMEVLDVDGLEGHGVEEGGAVDEDVNLGLPCLGIGRQVALHGLDNLGAALRRAEVGADRNGLDIVCF